MHVMFKFLTGKLGYAHIQAFLAGKQRGFCVKAEADGKKGYLAVYHGEDQKGWKFSEKLASRIRTLRNEGHPVWVYSCYSAYCSNPPSGGFSHLTKIPVKWELYEATGYMRIYQ